MTIKQLPLDCANGLSDKGFQNPATIAYNKWNPPLTIAYGYTDIFNQINSVPCSVTNCILKEPGCAAPLIAQSNVVIWTLPFWITAKQNEAAGYTVTFCYECTITDGAGTLHIFTKDSITVTARPLDCSTALTDAGFVNPLPIAFNSVGSPVPVAAGYTAIFNHLQQTDCPLSSCSLKE